MNEPEVSNLLRERRGESPCVSFVSHSAARGGAERSLLELLRGLTARGMPCHVVLPRRGPLADDLVSLGVPFSVIPIPWWTLSGGEEPAVVKRKIDDSVSELVRELRRVNPRVVCTNTSVICQGAMAAGILGKSHVWFVKEYGEKDHGLDFILFPPERAAFISGRSAGVIFNSRALRDHYLALGADAESSEVVYTFIDTAARRGTSPPISPRFEAGGHLKLLFLAAITPRKGAKDAVLAARLLAERNVPFQLIVAGRTFSASYRDELLSIIREARLERPVSLVGYVDEPLPLIEQADIVLACSVCEAFGRVVLEAMLCGKAVIGTRRGGTLEQITPGVNGLLYTPGDFRELSEKTAYLLRRRDKIMELGANARRHAASAYSDESYSGRIYRILREIGDCRSTVPRRLPRTGPRAAGRVSPTAR